jgi:hypothetical protein
MTVIRAIWCSILPIRQPFPALHDFLCTGGLGGIVVTLAAIAAEESLNEFGVAGH